MSLGRAAGHGPPAVTSGHWRTGPEPGQEGQLLINFSHFLRAAAETSTCQSDISSHHLSFWFTETPDSPPRSSLNGEEITLAETLKKKTKACFY